MAQANRRFSTICRATSASALRITIRPENPGAEIDRHIYAAVTDLHDLARVVTLMI